MLHRLLIAMAIVAVVLFGLIGVAPAANPHDGGSGQPNQSCEEIPALPGNSSGAPGSPFNEEGVSGTKYAGEQPQNSKNPKSVSQYDVACFQQASH